MNILVLFYSAYGHTFRMAEAVAAGAGEIDGAKVVLKRVPETLPVEVLKNIGVIDAQEKFKHIPLANPQELEDFHAIIFGTPTRFGNMASQMRTFLDGTGGLWTKGALVGKVGSVFTSTSTQHGGQESTIISFHTTLLHHGMLIAGLPYTFADQTGIDEVKGGSPYGATTIAGSQGERLPSEIELQGAKFQGKYVAEITQKLSQEGEGIKTRQFDL
ncbi:MAG: NAD(P)H:quinone oxidoreductase [Eubacteriales bacterium]